MATMTLNLPNKIISFLEAEAKRTGSTKEEITENALQKYIEACCEDAEDAKEAEDVIQQIESGKMKTYTLDEVVEELGL